MKRTATNFAVLIFLTFYLLLASSVLTGCSVENRLQRKADRTGKCQYKPARKAVFKGFL